jgi:hypothetical protein
MLARSCVVGFVLALLPGAAVAQKLPADCSAAKPPAQPVEVSVGGVKFKPKEIKLFAAGSMKTEDEQFDSYRLELQSEADTTVPPLEASVTIIVTKGTRIDGKVFRRLPTKDRDKQPTASKKGSELEVQGWSFKDRKAKADFSAAQHIGSLRLEFGQRKGDTIPGSINLCVAKGQTTIFDKTPTKEDSYAVGTFEARLTK